MRRFIKWNVLIDRCYQIVWTRVVILDNISWSIFLKVLIFLYYTIESWFGIITRSEFISSFWKKETFTFCPLSIFIFMQSLIRCRNMRLKTTISAFNGSITMGDAVRKVDCQPKDNPTKWLGPSMFQCARQ